MRKAILYAALPLIVGAYVVYLAALPLFVAATFDLLPRGNNGLGLGLLLAAGAYFGLILVVVGEAVVFSMGVVWLLRRRAMRVRARGAPTAAIPAARPEGAPQPPALPGCADLARS
jgi:hypothetical protein